MECFSFNVQAIEIDTAGNFSGKVVISVPNNAMIAFIMNSIYQSADFLTFDIENFQFGLNIGFCSVANSSFRIEGIGIISQ